MMYAAKNYALCLALCALPVCAQSTRPMPVGVSEIGPIRPDPSRSCVDPDAYVCVAVNGTLGPMGYVARPSLTAASQLSGVSPEALLASQNYNFPSVVLSISAMPVVNVPLSGQPSKLEAASEKDRYPMWLDATFSLQPQDANGAALPQACVNGDVQILGILPQQTVAGTKDSPVADAASAANSVAGAVASFYPGVKTQASAATSAMNVLFQAIFPPQPVANQYSYQDGNCTFGWYFRPKTGAETTGDPSILGTQTGIILLKTNKDTIKQIQITGRTLSLWNKPASKVGDFYYGRDRRLPPFALPDEKNIDYTHIADLSAFPALIPKAQALKILGMPDKTSDADWAAFVTQAKLTATPHNAAVTNATLSVFLGLKPGAPPVAQKPGGN